MLTNICSELTTLSQLAELAATLTGQRDAQRADVARLVRVAPLPGAARTPLVAALTTLLRDQRTLADSSQNSLPSPILYVVAEAEQAARAYEDLCQWLGVDYVWLYPATETFSYERISFEQMLLGRRLHVLQRLAACADASSPGGADTVPGPVVIVAPLAALLQPSLTREEVTDASQTLRIDDHLPQETLLRRSLELGYRVTAMVEERGEMARRGGLVDIWPTADALPLRIEWFGDEIDSMRRFDPQSQRSEQRLDTVTIGPPHEVPFWKREQVVQQVADLNLRNLRPEVREEWEHSIERLEMGGRSESWIRFVPFFHEIGAAPSAAACSNQRSLIAHLPASSIIVFSELALLVQAANDWHEQASEQRKRLVELGELVDAVPRPYLLWDELWQTAEQGLGIVAERATADDSPKIAQPLGAQASRLPQVGVWRCQTPTSSPKTSLPKSLGEKGHRNLPSTNPYRFVGLSNQKGEDALPSVLTWQSVELAAPEFTPADLFGSQLRRFIRDVQWRVSRGERVVVVSPQVARFQEMLQESQVDGVEWVHGSLEEGWHVPALRLTCYTDTEIFGWRHRRRGMRRRKERDTDERNAFLRGLKPGEYVVHIEHGIARYEGLVRREVGGIEREYLDLRFAGDDCLYVPVDQIDRVARYVGAGDAKPRLSRLGTQEWEQSKRKVRDAVEDLAGDLLDLYARRKLSDGYAFSPDNEWQQQLESSFPYVETEDQLRAMTEVKADMEEPHPMDRLICGDVGFGKTEVALRAAFKAVQDSKQVAILVPTTVLAQQHYETFKQRMASFPIEVEMLSRFRSTRQQQDILRRLSSGKVDIIVGTHRLLSNDVVFKDLGLLIVDEEQRFGVRHKERLKQLRTEIDVLTMTATPIPRTLHMALAGIRDMSAINTPPDDRMPIKTYIVPYTKALVRDVIQRELDRGGQVYYVHNRVHSIYHVVERLRNLLPDVNFGIGHGQMDEGELEQVMLDFYAGQYDVLVCTTIIENGLDVPTVNTILIDDAPMYGLSQLYQLRGRVGRSARRAYAYLLYRKNQYMTQEAQQRLQAIQEAVELGAGFRIAMRDLEIRGAGNMLGSEQSGYIATVGFDLYSRLLEQAVKQLREHGAKQRTPATNGKHADTDAAQQANGEQPSAPQIRVDEKVLVSPLVTLTLPVSAYLPDEYIADEQVRFRVYQRMQEAQSVEDVVVLRRELRDRFGDLPVPVVHLLVWLEVKILAVNAGVSSVTTSEDALLVRLPEWADARERVQRRFARDTSVQVGGQFVRIRYTEGVEWVQKVLKVLGLLGESG